MTTVNAKPLLISVEKIPAGTMLIVRGELDVATAAQLRAELLRHLATGESLWLDLEKVTFMDSSGLHVLIASQRRADLLDSHLVIARASTAVDRVLEVTGATALFARSSREAVPVPMGSPMRPSGDKSRDDRSIGCDVLEGTGP